MKKATIDTPKPGISLSLLAAIWMAAVIAVMMAAYALAQYFQMPDMTVRELITHHLWHVLVMGAAIHLACWLVFEVILIRPLNQIYTHLYHVGAGNVEKLELRSSVKELRTIVDGVNLMIWRLRKWLDSEALDNARSQIGEIGQIAEQIRMENEHIADALMKRVNNLEASLLSVVELREETRGPLQEKPGTKDTQCE